MRLNSRLFALSCVGVALSLWGSAVRGESPSPGAKEPTLRSTDRLSLASHRFQESETVKVTTTETAVSEDDWEIEGPVFLRPATPESPGEVIIKNIFEWEHSKKSRDQDDRDEYEYELEVEWGIAENHELIFEMPWTLGEGRVDGNGDLTVGWHWRLWSEQDGAPAFALRNFVRLPSGVDSSGVDYELRGLITKTLVPGSTRFHVNPFAKSVNGNNEEDAEHFQYGMAIGVDHRVSDEVLLVADYLYSSAGNEDDNGSNHEAEFGLDWGFADHQKLGLALVVGLDGDSDGPAVGARISYMFSFGP